MKRKNKDYQSADDWMQIMLHGRSIENRRNVSDQSIRRRLLFMSAGMIILFALLGLKLFEVQVISGQELRELANGNRIREIIEYAPRGKILDRNGRVLADNSLSFQLTTTPYLLEDNPQLLRKELNTVSAITGMSRSAIERTIEKAGVDSVLPVLIDETLTHEQALLLESHLNSLRGFRIEEVPVRSYDSTAGLAHIIGYAGRVSERDLEEHKDGSILPTDFIGKTGVEQSFDKRLRGRNGWIRYEVDALGRPVRVIDQQQPKPGEDIHLSIDYKMQKAMWGEIKKQLKESNTVRGAGVAVDPLTGELLAMVSVPAYDNNLFVGGIAEADFARLNTDPNQPLYNKALSGGYTSGSIIKPILASAALQEGVVDENTVIVDTGAITLPGGFTFLGWMPGGLGPMNVRRAIAWSSNIYFYTVGGGNGGIVGLGEERITKYYRMYGLGEPTGINLPNETQGRVPDEAWKLDYKGEPWYQGDSFNISIGQGDLLISPLQITMAEATIANNGYLLTPQIEKGAPREVRREVKVDKRYLQIVREGMRQVLTDGTTCECTFSDVNAVVAGKSGTAETDTPGGRRPHAWFTAFAPYSITRDPKPEVLATVIVEEGSGGSLFAAPVIAKTFESYFGKIPKKVGQN